MTSQTTEPRVLTTTIASGTSLSAVINLSDATLVGLQMPTAWDAANIYFKAATTAAGTYQDIYDDAGNAVYVIAAASRYIGIDIASLPLAGCQYIKLQSGPTGATVDQTAARTIAIVAK